MSGHPVAAGKSSFDLIDSSFFFSHIVTEQRAVYLDLACGVGRYTVALADVLSPGSVIHALDLWEEGIESLKVSAKEHGLENVRAAVADITQVLPLDSSSVDVCFIATALHDLREEKRPGLIAEIGRVLVPDGRLAIVEFKQLDHGPGPGLAKRLGESDLDSLVLPNGFAKGEAVDLGEFTYLAQYIKGE